MRVLRLVLFILLPGSSPFLPAFQVAANPYRLPDLIVTELVIGTGGKLSITVTSPCGALPKSWSGFGSWLPVLGVAAAAILAALAIADVLRNYPVLPERENILTAAASNWLR